jgi:cytidylate kinase
MKKLIFINGPAGIGKTSVCRILHAKLPNSAWLESEWCRNINPFIFNPEIELMVEKNLSCILGNYLRCSMVEFVLFNWGLHAPRKQIFDKVIHNLESLEFKLIPVTLMCSEAEHIKRMITDGRNQERIDRSIGTREIYSKLNNLIIDTTELTVEETVSRILEDLKTNNI